MTIDEDYAFVRDDVNLLIGYFVLCILDFKHSGYLNFRAWRRRNLICQKCIYYLDNYVEMSDVCICNKWFLFFLIKESFWKWNVKDENSVNRILTSVDKLYPGRISLNCGQFSSTLHPLFLLLYLSFAPFLHLSIALLIYTFISPLFPVHFSHFLFLLETS